MRTKKNRIAVSFVFFIVTMVVISLVLSKVSFDKSSEIETKVDYRFTSYDNYFFHTNSIVVDSIGKKIGDVVIFTNEKEINDFYSDSTRRKTQYYYNLVNEKLKVKLK